ncbi:adenylate/guanylate cyclase domain-containing protein [Legionella genomosp. 1]|uniref:adenylate/guanylate cyclase domain-containing protein n=1 Tax=Legionella genomosp. 1 TaxID=1093625 RepID=UPI001055A54B|nr:adenylate/guanylate cyclase domain-containing protein [Legionella genomosp. 1]
MQVTTARGLIYLVRFIKMLCTLVIILIAISFLSHYISDPKAYPVLMKLNQFTNSHTAEAIGLIKRTIPYQFSGTDFSQIILIALISIVLHFLSLIQDKLGLLIYKRRESIQYQQWRKKLEERLSREQMQEIDSKFSQLDSSLSSSERRKMLKEFARLKSKLDAMGQQLAFLSIDVVDSTGMKRNEDKYLAAYDFDRYNELVIQCLKENHVIKYAMTPDGMMSCFQKIDEAVSAAKMLLERLVDFNQHSKQIKRNFHVRCGINGGFVYIDDDTPLEQVSDRAIDIAGHMQKHAKPDCINIAASAIEPLKNREGFAETRNIVDEQKVYEWGKQLT